jgi:predicted HD phosphohydrolase
MSPAEAAQFEQDPAHGPALRLRRWDDEAKVPGRVVAGVDRWEPVVRALVEDNRA